MNSLEYPDMSKIITDHTIGSIETDVFIETLKKYQTDYPDKDIMNLSYLKINASVSISYEEGMTPLVLAIRLNHLETVEILIQEFQVDINLAIKGWTPIIVATYYSQIEIMDCLINAGVNIHCKNNFNILGYAAVSNTPKKKILYLRNKLSTEDYAILMNEKTKNNYYPLELLAVNNTTNSIRADKCMICLDTINYKSCFLECGHNFHIKCINLHLRQSPKCPLCNEEDTCEICHLHTSNIKVKTACNHQFHINCLNKYCVKDRNLESPKCHRCL